MAEILKSKVIHKQADDNQDYPVHYWWIVPCAVNLGSTKWHWSMLATAVKDHKGWVCVLHYRDDAIYIAARFDSDADCDEVDDWLQKWLDAIEDTNG